MMFELEGDGSPFEMKNNIDLSISISHIHMIAAFKVFIIEDRFMEMQLENMLNLNCWLAMIPSPEIDDKGLLVNTTADLSIELVQLLMSLSDLQVDLECISCSTNGLNNVTEIFDTIHDSSAIIYDIKERLITFTAEILQGQWLKTQISRVLHHAPKQCPSDPGYVENYEVQEYGTLPFPSLSRESVEMVILCKISQYKHHLCARASLITVWLTLLFVLFYFVAGIVLGEIASVVVAESHRDMDMGTSDPLSAQNNFNTPPNITLVDLSNMNTTLNGFADMAISELKSAMSNIVEDPQGPNASGEDIGINVQLRSLLLDDERTFSIDIDDLSFSTGGITVRRKSPRHGYGDK